MDGGEGWRPFPAKKFKGPHGGKECMHVMERLCKQFRFKLPLYKY